MFRVIIFALLIVFDVVISDDTERIHKKCHEETGVNEERIPNAMKGEFPDGDEVFKCYIKCLITEMGVMNEDGVFAFSEDTLSALPSAYRGHVKNMGENCVPLIKSEDLCQKAFDLHKCAYNMDPENYILF